MLKKVIDPEFSPPHPGEILREDFLPSIAMSRAALSRHLGISSRTLNEVLAERRPVTFAMAQKLGGALGTGVRYWIGLQAQYDIWLCERGEPPRILPVKWRKKPHFTSNERAAGVERATSTPAPRATRQ